MGQHLKANTGDALEIRVGNDRVGVILGIDAAYKDRFVLQLAKRGASCRQETHRVQFSPQDGLGIDLALPTRLCCLQFRVWTY